MEFIPPSEIASKVMTLLIEAKKEIIIVSPYVNITDWEKMKRSLKKAVENNVTIKFFVRNGTNDDLKPLKELGITPIKIENLHAKVFINENYAIATSQNIIEYSDKYSIDFGYKTETVEERKELIDFVNTYVDINKFIEVDEVILGSISGKVKVNVEDEYIRKSLNSPIFETKNQQIIKDKFNKEFKNLHNNHQKKYLYFLKNSIPNTEHVRIDNNYSLKINSNNFDYHKFISVFTSNQFTLINSYLLKVCKSGKIDNEYKYLHFNNEKLNSTFEDLVTDYITITKILLNNDFKIA